MGYKDIDIEKVIAIKNAKKVEMKMPKGYKGINLLIFKNSKIKHLAGKSFLLPNGE